MTILTGREQCASGSEKIPEHLLKREKVHYCTCMICELLKTRDPGILQDEIKRNKIKITCKAFMYYYNIEEDTIHLYLTKEASGLYGLPGGKMETKDYLCYKNTLMREIKEEMKIILDINDFTEFISKKKENIVMNIQLTEKLNLTKINNLITKTKHIDVPKEEREIDYVCEVVLDGKTELKEKMEDGKKNRYIMNGEERYLVNLLVYESIKYFQWCRYNEIQT